VFVTPTRRPSRIARQRVAQRHAGAQPDQDGVYGAADVLWQIANASPDPLHIKPRQAEGNSGQHLDSSVPAVKSRKAIPHWRNQLNRSGEHYNYGRDKVHGNGEIAFGHSGDVTIRYLPSVEIPT
jgi:hypothetical protein